MIDPVIVVSVFALALYVFIGVVFEFRWFYHLMTLAGYFVGVAGAGTLTLLILA